MDLAFLKDLSIQIPPDAQMDVLGTYPEGGVRSCYYLLNGKRVAYRSFDRNGIVQQEYNLRGEDRHGWEIEYHEHSHQISYCAYSINGKLQGKAYQLNQRGELICFSEFDQGNGIELWCGSNGPDDPNYQLTESYHFANGEMVLERWWVMEDTSVIPDAVSYEVYRIGDYSLYLEWDINGNLLQDFPEFSHLDGQVTEENYEPFRKQEPNLPPLQQVTQNNLRQAPASWVEQFNNK